MTGRRDGPVVIPFPGPRRKAPTPSPAPAAPRDLGLTPLSRALGPVGISPRGHWCDRCRGVWYSHFGEARCPVCGGRG